MREGIRLGDANVTIGFKALSMKDMNVISFEGLGVQTELEYMYLQGNKLQNFLCLGSQPNLREIHLQGNKISSFAGLVKQPKLESVNIRNNPIAKHEYCRLMVLLCAGSSVRFIDGEKVGYAERDIVRRLPEAAAFAVSCGWLLDLKRRTYEEYLSLADSHLKQYNAPVPMAPPSQPKQLPDVHSVLTSNILNLPSSDRPSHNLDVSEGRMRMSQDSGIGAGTGHMSPPPPSTHSMLDSPSHSQLRNAWTPVGGYSVSSSRRESGARRQAVERPSNVRASRETNMHHLGVTTTGESTSAAMTKLQRANHELRTQLDEALAVNKRDKVRGKNRSPGIEHDPMVSCLLFEELDNISELSFSQGIRINSSASFTAKRSGSAGQTNINSIASACLTIDTTHLCVAHFFNRIRVGEFAFTEIKELLLDYANNIIFIRTKDDTMVEINVESSPKLITIYKVLHSRLGIVPELPKGIAHNSDNIQKIKKKVKRQSKTSSRSSSSSSRSSSDQTTSKRSTKKPFQLEVANNAHRKQQQQQIIKHESTTSSDSETETVVSVAQMAQAESKPKPIPVQDAEISLLSKRKVSAVAEPPPKPVEAEKPVKATNGPPIDLDTSSESHPTPAAVPSPQPRHPPPAIEKESVPEKRASSTPSRKSSKSSSKSLDSDEEWQRQFEARQRKIILSENPTLY